ncbi:TULIP family P47-like protein, partial [Escherichia coli]|nr:TULIP family P47-like protein [Escherichia coli]
AQAGTSPPGFDALAQKGISVDARFGAWRILPDSDGPTLSMELPLTDITLTDHGQTRHYDTGRAMVDVHLELLPHDPNEKGDTRLFLLVVKLRAERAHRHAAEVTRVELDDTGGVVDQAYVMMALGQWLDQNLHQFTQVFATVNIHKVVDQNAAFAWLKPTH